MKIGFAVCDITPETGIYLTGYGMPERLAESVHSPLTATVMVLKEGDLQAAVIGLDWCFVDWPLTQEIRRAICEKTRIPEKNILLCCSHTHSAPHTTFMRTLGRVAVDPENKGIDYVRRVTPVIADGCSQAQKAMRETEACFGSGRTKTGVSRRSMDETGKISLFTGDPDAIYDDNMTAVRFRDRETSEDLGILVHCSAHNTAMGADRNISSDWCGVMKKRIHDAFPVPVLFINGALGDVGPRTRRRVSRPGCHGFSAGGGDGAFSALEVGLCAAGDALDLLESMRDFRADLPLKVSNSVIRLPQSIPMSEAEAREIIAKYTPGTTDTAEPPLDFQLAKIALETWKKPPEPEFEFEQTLLSFGPLALAPFPFEMFSVFSLRLRKYGPFEYTLLCSNTNGRNAYMPDRGAIACGGYEATCRKTIRPYVTDPEAGDLAVVRTLEELRKMKQDRP